MRIHYIKVSFKLFCLFTGQKEYNSLSQGLMLHISSFYGGSTVHISIYYMEESVLLGTKPLVDSIRHFIRDLSGVFSMSPL